LAAGTNDAQAVIREMKREPIDDDLFGPVVVRPDGRAIHNMYIFRVKSPAASKSKWDLLEQVGLLTGPEAFRPLGEGGCSLLEQARNN
jgi:branched-chain amino acid transport system substrate-binding protein